MADNDTNWDYKPDADQTEPSARRPRKEQTLTWTASEYIDHDQGPMWFLSLLGVTAVLAALVFLITRDYFATGVIFALGILVGVFAKRKPRQLTYELSADGLKIGDRAYSYRSFRSFSIIQDGALLSLNLAPMKRFMMPISVYFAPGDHEKIMDIVGDRLPYEDKQLDFVERLTRRLRI